MKRLFKRASMAVLAMLVLCACNEGEGSKGDMIWDFVNPSVRFMVTDSAGGENLLDPS